MHHPVSGINFLILSVSLASHVSTHLLTHLLAHLYHHYHSHHPSLKGQINAFLKRAFKYGFCTSVHTIDVIAEKADRSLYVRLIRVLLKINQSINQFTLPLQAQNLPFQQILPSLDFYYLPDFMTVGLDRTYHAHRFIFSFTF